MKNLLNSYLQLFDEYPPKLKMVSYENEIYQQLMGDAIEDGIPITKEDVERAFEDFKFDIVK